MKDDIKEAVRIFKMYFLKPVIVVISMFCSFLFLYFNVCDEKVSKGTSMQPTLCDGDFVFGIKTPYAKIERGDIITFKPTYAVKHELGYDVKDKIYLSKRVIAVPGDVIEIQGDIIKINGELYEDEFSIENKIQDEKEENFSTRIEGILEEGEYFVLGDNRNESYDSRNFGLVYNSQITSKAIFSIKKYTEENESRFVFY